MMGLVAVSACSTDKITPEDQVNRHQLQFTIPPIKSSATRSTSFSAFDQSQTFGTTAYQLADGKNWTDDCSEATKTGIDGKEISYQNGVWKAEDGSVYYWDDFSGSLTFLSWYPYDMTTKGLSINANTKDFNYTDWTMKNTAGYGYTKDNAGKYVRNTTDGSIDLLLAESYECTEANSGDGVLTQFVHQLCNVKFYAMLLDEPEDDEEFHITKVELSGIYTVADLQKAATPTVLTGIWDKYSDAKTYTYTPTSTSTIDLTYDADNKTETEIFPQTLMLPQSVLSNSSSSRVPKVTIYYKDKSGTSHTLQGALATNITSDLAAWQAGKSITYHIYISTKDYWIDFNASTDSWTEGTGTDIPIDA